MRWHPDKCKDSSREEATSHFQQINLAFQTISKWKETGRDERRVMWPRPARRPLPFGSNADGNGSLSAPLLFCSVVGQDVSELREIAHGV